MTRDYELVLVVPAESGPADTSRTAGADAEISGLVLQTWRDGWTYCKASKKVVARYQWLPWLGGATAVVSALTGTTVFMTLQSEDSTVSRILVASVALFTAAIAALQAWTTSRVKGLNEQAKRFHEFHRRVHADLENRRDLTEAGYASKIERELSEITAGMSEPSDRAWRAAKAEMRADMAEICPRLSGAGATPAESPTDGQRSSSR